MSAPAQHAPRTMSAEMEKILRAVVNKPGRKIIAKGSAGDIFAELDAERAAHAETLAALEDVLHESGWGRDGALDAATERERNTTLWLVARIAATALQQEKGGRS